MDRTGDDVEPSMSGLIPTPTGHASMLGRLAVRITVWTSIGTYLCQLVGFMATLALTRLLTPEVFGIFSLATFWFTLLNLRSKLGIHYSAIRQAESNGTLAGTYWGLDAVLAGLSLIVSVVVGVVLLRLSNVLPQLGYTPLMIGTIIVLMLADNSSAIVSPLSMILEKEMQVSRLTLVTLIAAISAYSIAIVLALRGAGIGALLTVNIVATLVSLLGVIIVCRCRYPQAFHWRWQFDRLMARRLVREGLPIGLSLTALGSIVMQFDNFLIGTFVGAATLGYYDRAYRIASWPNILLTSVVLRIGFLTFTKARDDQARLTQAVRLSFWVMLILGIPIGLMLLFGAPDIVRILYGPNWSESAFFLRYLTIYSFLWPLINVGFWLSVAKGHTRATLIITLGQALTLIGLGTLFTLQWGAMGTILAVGVTMILAFSLSCSYVFRQVDLSLVEVFRAPAAAMTIAAVALLLISQINIWSSIGPMWRLAFIAVLGSGTYWLVLFALRPAETMERVQYVWRSWRKT
jgi:O-antigen/teichoic acid export membrane protein